MAATKTKKVSELKTAVPSRLELTVESMTEEMLNMGTMVAPRPQPHVFIYYKLTI